MTLFRFSILFFLSFISHPLLLSSQEPEHKECFGAALFELPHAAEEDGGAKKSVHRTEYGEKDRFTFWYRIESGDMEGIKGKIMGTRPEDVYDVSLYYHRGKDPCKELAHGDLNAIAPAASTSEGNERGYNRVSFSDSGRAGKGAYYLSVLHLGGKGCGHIASFRSGGQKVEVRAKARKCFQVPQTSEPEAKKEEKERIELVTGLQDSLRDELIGGELMIMDLESGKKRFLELEGDSSRTVTIKRGRGYRLKGEALGYRSKSKKLRVRKDTASFLSLNGLEEGEKIVLERIYFHPNTYAFRDVSRSSLNALKRLLEQRPDLRIEIQGHTASDRTIEEVNPLYRDKGEAWNFTGTAEELSLLRAKAVKQEMIARDIDPDRMRTKGFGAKQKLVEEPRTQKEERKNMRVEVRILE